MQTWVKRSVIGIGIVGVLAAIGLAKSQPLVVDAEKVTRATVSSTVAEKGKVVSEDTRDIFSEVQGKVKALYVDTGDQVKADQLLALLDVSDIESQISQLEGELKAIQGSERAAQPEGSGSQIRQQQLAVEQAETAFNLAETNYVRTKELFAEGAATAVELEQAKADRDNKQKALAQAESLLASLQKQSQGSKQQFQGQRESLQAKLEYLRGQKNKATVSSVQAGLIFAKEIKEGDFVTPGMLLFTVGNARELNIQTYVNVKDIANIKTGQQVEVIFKRPGDDVKVTGNITKIAPVTEERTSALGITEDKIKVTVTLREQPKDVELVPGMTVDVNLTIQQATDVVVAPKEAVFTDDGKDFIWVIRQDKAQLVQIQTGIEGDEKVEVRSGLKVGERVVMNPHLPELKEGIKIK